MEIIKTNPKQSKPPVLVHQGDVVYLKGGGEYYIIADVGVAGYKLIGLGSGSRYSNTTILAFRSFDIEVINALYGVKFEKVKVTLHVEDN